MHTDTGNLSLHEQTPLLLDPYDMESLDQSWKSLQLILKNLNRQSNMLLLSQT